MLKENLSAHIGEAALIDLTREMIRFNTINPPGDEISIARRLVKRMAELGLDAEVKPFSETRANVLCRLTGAGTRPALVFCGHIDTVPFGSEKWQYDPLAAEVVDGRIYGRGAADMKGGLAAMIVAASAIRRAGVQLQGDLVLALTAGEEVDSIGAAHFLQEGLLAGAGALIIAEPTGLEICCAEKGALWLEIIMSGKAAHASSPHLGKNAIVPMAALVQSLKKWFTPPLSHPLLGVPTMNIGTIEGGFKTNVVPDRCRLTVDFRTIPGQNVTSMRQTVETLTREAAELEGVEWDLRIINEREPVSTSPDDPFVQLCLKSLRGIARDQSAAGAVSYYTDGAVLAPALRTPMVIFGPGEAVCAHQADEWVGVESLRLAAMV
ncbi:MAG: M20 family metallopeptidase [Desulforhabdus sp.]|jgi:succinyl-diaminopimelate desuccinylase|nr:M20 family metallopeptidase [Desulforhabdus sp.]